MDSSVPNNSMSDRKAASEAKRSILNPFKGLKSLNSDQHQFSSLNIITKLNGKLILKILSMITYKKKLTSFIKFSY